jgi:hypothetical protein
MRPDNHTQAKHKSRINYAIGAGLLTPHAPLHHLPQIGIYMLVTLAGIGAVMGLSVILGWLLRRREDYYDH